MSAGLIDEATVSFRKVADMEPDNADIWLEFSHLYAEQEDYASAIDILNEGIVLQQSFTYKETTTIFKYGSVDPAAQVAAQAV